MCTLAHEATSMDHMGHLELKGLAIQSLRVIPFANHICTNKSLRTLLSLMDTENRVVVARGYRLGGGMEWELGISRCKLLYI